MYYLGDIHYERKEYEQAGEWFTKGAEAGLPQAMFRLGCHLDQGVTPPDYPAAADWYERAANAGHGTAANSLSSMYHLGQGRDGR